MNEEQLREEILHFFRFAASLGHGCGLIDGGPGFQLSPLRRFADAIESVYPGSIPEHVRRHIAERSPRAGEE